MKHKHHIIPKHMGGSDDPSNLIELTVDEHAEAHRILWETHGKKEDYVAWKALSNRLEEAELERREIAADGYRKFIASERGKKWIQETLVGRDMTKAVEAARKVNIGRIKTESENKKNSDSHLGKKHSPETIEKLKRIARNRSPEVLAKIASANRGKKRSEETKKRISEANKRRWQRENVDDQSFSDHNERGDPNE